MRKRPCRLRRDAAASVARVRGSFWVRAAKRGRGRLSFASRAILKSRSPAVRIRDGAPVDPHGGLRLRASGIGARAHPGGPVVQAVPRQHVLGRRRADRRQPRRASDRRRRDQSAISSGEAARIAAFDHGDIEDTGPTRGEADNVGDGFLFGGERHGPAAPFAGRDGLDPEGVAHFGFVSFGC